MAKKYPAKAPLTKQNIPVTSPTASGPRFSFTLDNLAPLVVSMVYLLVHFINNMEAYDAMGPQWLFLVIVDLLVILFILGRRNRYDIAANHVLRNLFSKLYLAFFVLAGLSTFVAINPTETWVCYVRLIATIIAFFNIAILMYGRISLVPLLAQLLGIVLFVESMQTLVQFLDEINRLTMTEAIMNLKGTTGNKNIFAAGLILKIPFVMYLIHTGGLLRKIINIVILAVSGTALFIVSARASYLSLLLITVLYIVFAILENRKEKNVERLLYRTGSVLVPIIIAFMISQIELSNVKSMQDSRDAGVYGSVTERFGSLSATSDESNAVRLRLWSHAIDYTVKHPLMGCGYGNWKIASIPYQRTITNDLYVPVHAHNDFVENFAELGIPGGLLYLSLFVVIAIFTYRTYYSGADQATRFASVFSFLAFTGYSVDAFFNFPAERPINQVFFALIAAINVVAYLDARKEEEKKTAASAGALKAIYSFSSILLLLPSLYITYLTYQSLIIQRKIIPDLNNEPLQLKWQEIFPKIPSMPNISASAQPLDAIKGRYLSEAGKFDEAIVLLDKGRIANPVIGYSEFLKAGIYFKQGKMDSAQRNAQYAFNVRPKAKTYYQTLMAVLAQTKDTVAIEKAFKEYVTYRNQIFGYDMYLRAILQATGRGTPKTLAIADSAYQKFKDDPEDTVLYQRKLEILRYMNAGASSASNTAQQAALLARAQNFYTAGVNAFTKAKAGAAPANRADYLTAARNFIQAGEIITNNYIIYENAGIAYFNLQDYPKAIQFFDRVIRLGTSVDGKSEYFKGVSLYNTGKQADGCVLIKLAAGKGYAEAIPIAKNNCK